MNKTIPFNDLYEADFNIEVLDSMMQYWKTYKTFSCLNRPKTKNIFVYLHNCTGKYMLKDGRVMYAHSGDIVFTPIGLEYKVEFDCPSEDSYTVGVNAIFFDRDGEGFIPEGDILIFNSSPSDCVEILFGDVNNLFMSSPICPLKIKSVFYEILSDLLRKMRNERNIKRKYDIIKDGILLIESGNCNEFTIKEIADKCNVSEIYFRRLFKEYSGISPMEYIINSKISRAKQYLKHENISIGNIAELCGFESVAYFSRLFKKKTGMSPLKYRNMV